MAFFLAFTMEILRVKIMKLSMIPATGLMLMIVACSGDKSFKSLPQTGFITHYEQSDKSRMSFDSYWDISDNKDWNERVEGSKGKSQEVHIKPVTTKYLADYPQEKDKAEDVEELRQYFDKKIKEKLVKLDKMDNTFHLVDKPTRNSYTVEIALLSIAPTNITANSAGAVAGTLARGAGSVLTNVSPIGHISMGARFKDPRGKLVAEVADFEKDESAVISYVLVDIKDFQYYAHHKRHIDIWCDQFAEIFTTTHEHKVKRPWFNLL